MASPKHYVNNKDFLNALVEYKAACRKAKRNKLPPPKIPNYVGDCIMQIAKRYSTKPNFSNYPFVDDMVADAIENCIGGGMKNFDEKITSNPFAYFTQIIHYAFLRRIEKEKVQLVTKYNIMLNAQTDALTIDERDAITSVDKAYTDNVYMNNLVKTFEQNKQEKREKLKQKKLEQEASTKTKKAKKK